LHFWLCICAVFVKIVAYFILTMSDCVTVYSTKRHERLGILPMGGRLRGLTIKQPVVEILFLLKKPTIFLNLVADSFGIVAHSTHGIIYKDVAGLCDEWAVACISFSTVHAEYHTI